MREALRTHQPPSIRIVVHEADRASTLERRLEFGDRVPQPIELVSDGDVPFAARLSLEGSGQLCGVHVHDSTTLSDVDPAGGTIVVALSGTAHITPAHTLPGPLTLHIETLAVGQDALARWLNAHLDAIRQDRRRLVTVTKDALEHLDASRERCVNEASALAEELVPPGTVLDGVTVDQAIAVSLVPPDDNTPPHDVLAVVALGGNLDELERTTRSLERVASPGRWRVFWWTAHASGAPSSYGVTSAVGQRGAPALARWITERRADWVTIVRTGTVVHPSILTHLLRDRPTDAEICTCDGVLDGGNAPELIATGGMRLPDLLERPWAVPAFLVARSTLERRPLDGPLLGDLWTWLLHALGEGGRTHHASVVLARGPRWTHEQDLAARVQPAVTTLLPDGIAITGVTTIKAPAGPALQWHLTLAEPQAPSLHVVIPTHRAAVSLESLLNGIVEERSRYPGTLSTTVIAHRAHEPAMVAVLDQATDHGFQVVVDEGEFNFSRLVNRAVLHDPSDLVLILNDDIVPRRPGWICELVASHRATGATVSGPTLALPDGTIQHAGLYLSDGIAAHHGAGRPLGTPGAYGELATFTSVPAVTGAAQLVDGPWLRNHGGLDEGYAVLNGDLELCLRAAHDGRRIVHVPTDALEHHESATRAGDASEARWVVANEEGSRVRRAWGWSLARCAVQSRWITVRDGHLALRGPTALLAAGFDLVMLGPPYESERASLLEATPELPLTLALPLPRDFGQALIGGVTVRGWSTDTTRAQLRVGSSEHELAPALGPGGWLTFELPTPLELRSDDVPSLVIGPDRGHTALLAHPDRGARIAPGPLAPTIGLWVRHQPKR